MTYSYSRLSTYNNCPRKHYYSYIEGLEAPKNASLDLGDMFHRCVDKVYKGESYDDVIKEYEDKVKAGVLEAESGMLEEVVKGYFEYYDIDSEKTIGSEMKLEEQWEDGDKFVGIIDRLVDKDGIIILRDTKTTTKASRRTLDDVRYNMQLLTYCAMAESDLNILVDAYEIDEVRLAKLQPVPVNLNGKPSADKNKLALVTYEAYRNKLCEMGLEDSPEYQPVLDYLEKRGHPLFKRLRCQLSDRGILDSNIDDLYDLYKGSKSENKARCRGPLCDYCPFKDLCNLDMHKPLPEDREIYLKNFTKKVDNSTIV